MKEQKLNLKIQRGITLIALVITIIVLLILAGVSIATLTGENGILTQAQNSKLKSEIGEERESIAIAYNGAKIENIRKGIRNVTAKDMNDQFEINRTLAYAEGIEGTEKIKITFNESGRIYTIEENGEIIDPTMEEETTWSFVKISDGGINDLLLDDEGNLWNWEDKTTEPQKIEGLGTTFIEISAGDSHSMALDKDGNIWTWGNNSDGQLGNGTTENKIAPQKLEGLGTTFIKISAGDSYSIALDKEGNIWTWGYNYSGQLGDGTTEDKTTPQKLEGLGTTFIEISAGDSHSIALDKDGNIWTWGDNYSGKLGDGTTEDRTTPQKLEGLGETYIEISAGNSHSMALDKDGNIWTWGDNYSGKLGDGTTDDKTTPQKLEGLGETYIEISAGNSHSMALDKDRNIWTWGYNYSGQLGEEIYWTKINPQKLEGIITTFKEISCKGNSSMGLDIKGIPYYTAGDNFLNHLRNDGLKYSGKNFVDILTYNNIVYYIDNEGNVWTTDDSELEIIDEVPWNNVIASYTYNESTFLLDEENNIYTKENRTITYIGNINNLSETYKMQNENLYINDGANWIETIKNSNAEDINIKIVLDVETGSCKQTEYSREVKIIMPNFKFNKIGDKTLTLLRYNRVYSSNYEYIDNEGNVWKIFEYE